MLDAVDTGSQVCQLDEDCTTASENNFVERVRCDKAYALYFRCWICRTLFLGAVKFFNIIGDVAVHGCCYE